MFKAICVGNLTSDPETRDVGPDTVTNFGIALNTRGKDATVFARVSVWGKRGEIVKRFFRKGSKIAFIGSVGVPKVYTTKDGRTGVDINITMEDFDFCEKARADSEEPAVKQKPTRPEDFQSVEAPDLPF